MATCDYQDLLDINPCFSGLSAFNVQVIKTQLLCQWARGCDISSLLEDAACFASLDVVQMEQLKAQLLCNIVNNEIPIATLYPASAVFTWVVPTAEIDGAPFWDNGDPPEFSCGDTTVDLETSYYFGLLQGQNPNDFLTAHQIECMIEIAQIVVDDYLTGSGDTEVSREYWWQWVPGPLFGFLRGDAKAASDNCDPNNPVGNTNGNFPGGAVELSIKLCVTPP